MFIYQISQYEILIKLIKLIKPIEHVIDIKLEWKEPNRILIK